MVVHQNITNLAGYFHFLNVRKIPYVIIPPSAIAQLKRRISMSSKWAFIGGILAGVAGVFTAAAVAVELEDRKSGNGDAVEESEQPALPENEGRQRATDML